MKNEVVGQVYTNAQETVITLLTPLLPPPRTRGFDRTESRRQNQPSAYIHGKRKQSSKRIDRSADELRLPRLGFRCRKRRASSAFRRRSRLVLHLRRNCSSRFLAACSVPNRDLHPSTKNKALACSEFLLSTFPIPKSDTRHFQQGVR